MLRYSAAVDIFSIKNKHTICRVGNSLIGFLGKLLVFCEKNERMSDLRQKTSNSLICSFLVSDLSDSLMLAHFWWATWANRSNFWWATWAICSNCSLKKRQWAKRLFKKTYQKYDFSQIFLSESLVFVSKRANVQFSQKNERFAHLLIYHEQPERNPHSWSFVISNLSNSLTVALLINMSNLSDWLTVAHLSWAIWVSRSQSLIWFERSERMSDKRMSEFPMLGY